MDDKIAPPLPNHDVQLDTAFPVLQLDAALEDLLALHRQHQLRRGDIKKFAEEHGIAFKSKAYWRLSKRLYRIIKLSDKTGGAVERSSWSHSCASAKPDTENKLDVHGWECYSTEVPPQFAKMLPWVGKGNRGYWRIKTPEVTLNAFASGKIVVFPHSLFWKQVLAVELKKCGWDGLNLDQFFSSLHRNGETGHVAFSDPQCPSAPTVFENGLWKITYHRDKTPNPQGSAEITVNAQGLESAIATIQAEVSAIPERLKTYLGSLTINQLLTQMAIHIEKQGERYQMLEEKVQALEKGNSAPNDVGTCHLASGVAAGANDAKVLASSEAFHSDLPTVLTESSPAPIHCPLAKELSPGIWSCGSRIVFEGGQARINPFPCLHPGFEKCHYSMEVTRQYIRREGI